MSHPLFEAIGYLYLSTRGRLLVTTALAIGVTGASTPPAFAICTLGGTTVTCTGDVSAGFATTGAIDQLDINTLTTDIGGNGIRITDTNDGTLNFNADLTPFDLQPSGGDVFSRNGIHLITDGSIQGIINGTVTGQIANDLVDMTNAFGFPDIFGAVGFEAGTGIDVTLSNIDVIFPAITETTTGTRADVSLGRFSAVRAESDAGDVTINNANTVTLSGGQRTVESTRTSGLALAYGIDFTTIQSDISGILAQGNEGLMLNQTGELNVSGGGATATATTANDDAASQAWYANTSGIYIPAFTTTDGVNPDPTLPRFQTIDITTGNIVVKGGDVNTTAIANSTGAGLFSGSAQVTIRDRFGAMSATGLNIGGRNSIGAGVLQGQGTTIDVHVTGDVAVMGGNGTGIATASLGGPGETAGRVWTAIEGQDAVGISITPYSGSTGTMATDIKLNVDGAISTTGGDATSISTGSGSGQVFTNPFLPELGSSFDDQGAFARGGNATGIQVGGVRVGGVSGFQTGTFTLNAPVTVRAGSATVRHTGKNPGLEAMAQGGNATGIYLRQGTSGTPLNTTINSDINIFGPDLTTEVSGTGVLGQITTAGHTGLRIESETDGAVVTYAGVTTYTGGTNAITATDGALVDFAATGSATLVSLAFRGDNVNGTFINEGNLVAVGGDLNVSGTFSDNTNGNNLAGRTHTLVGQSLIGIAPGEIASSSGTTIDHRGTIDLTAGNGAAGMNSAIGISTGSFFSGSGDVNVHVSGFIRVEGGNPFDIVPDGTVNTTGAGIGLGTFGLSTVDIDGGTINTFGVDHAGIRSNAANTKITLQNNASITANGAGAAGINLGAFSGFVITDTTFGSVTQGSVNQITIEEGSSITSALSTGIRDVSQLASFFTDFTTGDLGFALGTLANSTTVDLAGTVTGGNGTAIDLGNGSDRVILRTTAVANGDVLLGEGDDRLAFEDGFTINSTADGGGGTDTIEADVNAGARRDFDLEPLGFLGFEVIEKTGLGTLDILGDTITDPYLLLANQGTTEVTSNQMNLSASVAAGASLVSNAQLAAITNGGNLSVGSQLIGDVGSLNVGGDLILLESGMLHIDILAPAQSDLIEVGGETTLGGTLDVNAIGLANDFANPQEFIIIDSQGGVSGDFNTVTDNLPDLDLVVGVDPNGASGELVVLGFEATTPAPDPDPAPDPEPTSEPNPTSDPGPDPDPAPEPDSDPQPPQPKVSDKSVHPNSLQGAAHAGSQLARYLQNRRVGQNGNGNNPFGDGPIVRFAAAGPDLRAGKHYTWGSAFGSLQDVETSATVAGFDAQTSGLAFGYEHVSAQEGAQTVLGFAANYGQTNLDSGLSSAEINTYSFGVYGSYAQSGWLFSGALTYGIQNYDIDRVIPIAGGFVTANGKADGQVWAASAKLAYDIAPSLNLAAINETRLAPYVRLDHVNVDRDAFTETGAGVLNLAVTSDEFSQSSVTLGIETSSVIRNANGKVMRPYFDLHWEHIFDGRSATSNSFVAGTPAAAFSTAGAFEDRDRLGIGAGVRIDMKNNSSLDVRYNGSLAEGYSEHSASVEFIMSF